jgi:predicted dinucleotide-binding enzyme
MPMSGLTTPHSAGSQCDRRSTEESSSEDVVKIAIIGAGSVGSALAGSSVRAGHTVTVTSADPAATEATARTTGARPAGSNREAVATADLIILAVPANVIVGLVTELGDALHGKTLVDVTNRPTPDLDRGTCTSSAEEVQAAAPMAHVIKAINTVFAARQAEPEMGGDQADGYVAGDDPEAKRAVLEFVESIGLRPFDVGPLANARTLEGMGWLHISLAMEHDWSWQSAWRLVGSTTS